MEFETLCGKQDGQQQAILLEIIVLSLLLLLEQPNCIVVEDVFLVISV